MRHTAVGRGSASPVGGSPGNACGTIELPEVELVAEPRHADTSAMPAFQDKMNAMDQSRDSFLLPKFGATYYNLNRETIEGFHKVITRQSTKYFSRRLLFLTFQP
jgi:hypothetical protein